MSRRSVLIVDDNVEFRRLARRLLETAAMTWSARPEMLLQHCETMLS